jgi:hypothetical protein
MCTLIKKGQTRNMAASSNSQLLLLTNDNMKETFRYCIRHAFLDMLEYSTNCRYFPASVNFDVASVSTIELPLDV